MKRIKLKLDSEYFRHLMKGAPFTGKETNIKLKTEDLAKILGVSRPQMDSKIKKGSFDIYDAKVLEDVFKRPFDEIFKFIKED
ncbi:MAG: hypothetical protein EHM20_00155 [Alphaproteobacteria bacterium]|nr:MAG: hypothetical protein EHM20_00155 [Alphaproteobacteria bacterium]